MYALFIFSAYSIPSLFLIGAILYDCRLLDASAFSFCLIGWLSVYNVLPIAGIIGIIFGASLEIISILGNKYIPKKTINLKEVIKNEVDKTR